MHVDVVFRYILKYIWFPFESFLPPCVLLFSSWGKNLSDILTHRRVYDFLHFLSHFFLMSPYRQKKFEHRMDFFRLIANNNKINIVVHTAPKKSHRYTSKTIIQHEANTKKSVRTKKHFYIFSSEPKKTREFSLVKHAGLAATL